MAMPMCAACLSWHHECNVCLLVKNRARNYTTRGNHGMGSAGRRIRNVGGLRYFQTVVYCKLEGLKAGGKKFKTKLDDRRVKLDRTSRGLYANKTVERENKEVRETKLCPIKSIHAIYVDSGRPMI